MEKTIIANKVYATYFTSNIAVLVMMNKVNSQIRKSKKKLFFSLEEFGSPVARY